MTLYWWMHWFWITSWIFVSIFRPSASLVHSNVTALPLKVSGAFNHSTVKPMGGLTRLITSTLPSVVTKTTLAPRNITYTKYNKTSQKKIEYLFANVTAKNKTKEENDKGSNEKEKVRETVIHVSENITDNQVLVNASFIAINRTDNLTYLEADVSFNQSLIRNSERLGVEEEEEDINISESNLSAAGITGITLGCVVIVGVLSGVSFFIYRNRGFNRPQVLNDRCSNPDSSGYIDDASVRDNSEEMYSLDNDSFLNSLEAMTIQNYWTDTVKHTKL